MKKEIVIEPVRLFSPINLPEIWEHRELLYFLVWRDIIVRYKQTILGFTWTLIKPVVTMLIFIFVFNRLAGFSSDKMPYSVFVFTGILAWNFFLDAFTSSSASLLTNMNIISKVYFPRLIIPLTAALKGLIDFSIAAIFYVFLMFYFSIWPGMYILLLPLAAAWGLIIALGFGLWFGSLSVKYRDISNIIPFFIQSFFFLSPIAYSSSTVSSKLEIFYWLNPITGLVELFRLALTGQAYIPLHLITESVLASFIILGIGITSFKYMEKDFVDIV
jgi:lipopolysaccharide transport system permease protein